MGGVRRVEGIERLSFYATRKLEGNYGDLWPGSPNTGLSLQPPVSVFLPFSLSLG